MVLSFKLRIKNNVLTPQEKSIEKGKLIFCATLKDYNIYV